MDDTLQPVAFSIRPNLPVSSFDSEAELYLKKTRAHVEQYLNENPFGDSDLISDPERKFFMLKSSFGAFKSAYAEAALQ